MSRPIFQDLNKITKFLIVYRKSKNKCFIKYIKNILYYNILLLFSLDFIKMNQCENIIKGNECTYVIIKKINEIIR